MYQFPTFHIYISRSLAFTDMGKCSTRHSNIVLLSLKTDHFVGGYVAGIAFLISESWSLLAVAFFPNALHDIDWPVGCRDCEHDIHWRRLIRPLTSFPSRCFCSTWPDHLFPTSIVGRPRTCSGVNPGPLDRLRVCGHVSLVSIRGWMGMKCRRKARCEICKFWRKCRDYWIHWPRENEYNRGTTLLLNLLEGLFYVGDDSDGGNTKTLYHGFEIIDGWWTRK